MKRFATISSRLSLSSEQPLHGASARERHTCVKGRERLTSMALRVSFTQTQVHTKDLTRKEYKNIIKDNLQLTQELLLECQKELQAKTGLSIEKLMPVKRRRILPTIVKYFAVTGHLSASVSEIATAIGREYKKVLKSVKSQSGEKLKQLFTVTGELGSEIVYLTQNGEKFVGGWKPSKSRNKRKSSENSGAFIAVPSDNNYRKEHHDDRTIHPQPIRGSATPSQI